jgi:ATP-dependent DNA helicase DinG
MSHARTRIRPSQPSPGERVDDPAPNAEGPDAVVDMPELAECDLAEFFRSGGPLAQHLYGYELRPSQLDMAEAVKRALLNGKHAIIEAPTGTGKSLAYLLPAILSGKTVVVATANKSLQNQLFTKDIPFLRRVLDRAISAVVVKGRSNFLCSLKWDKEVQEQSYISLYDREDSQVSHIKRWLQETETGDVDDLPFVLNPDLRPRIVSFADDCLHGECRHFNDNCWVNQMRDLAADAQILVTNHHLLLNALELGEAGERILPPAAIYVIDEAHQLEQTATAVYETNVTDYTVEQLLSRSVFKEHADDDELDELRFRNTLAFQEVAQLSRENSFRIEGDLAAMKELGSALRDLATRMKKSNPYGEAPERAANGNHQDDQGEARKIYELGIEALNSAANKLLIVASAGRQEELVRYAVRIFDRRHISLEVHAAPIDAAGLLSRFLFHPEADGEPVRRTVICTSATLATNGHFDHFKRRCGIFETGEEHVMPAVFDYPRQALLYQPPLPAYDYRNADAYYDGVAREIERLLEVSRGRTLCLFTSWSGLQQVSDRLQALDTPVIWPLRAQGDAPRNALLSWFLGTPHSVLLATRSFWEGVDIPGDDLSLVVLDKLPFPTPNDPLHSARMTVIDENGGSSFGEYMVPLMTLTLKQGFGRLIRRSSDRGVVAILDERLSSKGYGRQARHDLPPARFSRDFKDVHRFFQEASGSAAEFAVNVWAAVNDAPLRSVSHPSLVWRSQVLRLQDGRADRASGELSGESDLIAGELHALLHGLRDLQRRITQANRTSGQYAVEVRCSEETGALLLEENPPPAAHRLWHDWQQERKLWRAMTIVALSD